jgi:hypothetical protein
MADKRLNIKVRTQGAKRAKKDLKGVESGIAKMGKAAAIAAAAFFGAKKLIAGLQKTVDLAARLEGVETGFINLSKAAGFSAQTFNKLQKATDGTVDAIGLMTQANNAMLLGIFESEDQMSNMFDTAQRLARALGKDAVFGIESLVTGMGRQSKLMLDNLGIMIKTEDAYKEFAKNLGVSVSELTDLQRKQAFVNATIKEANKLVSTLGEEQLTTADSMKRMEASTEKLQTAIGKKLAPLMKILADDTARVADNMTRLLEGIEEEASIEIQTENLIKRAEALRIVTSASKEAIKINDQFFETFSKGVSEENLVKSDEERKAQLASLESQIAANILIIAEKFKLKNVITDIKRDEGIVLETLKEVAVPTQKMARGHEQAAKWASQTSIALATSALSGDNVSESLKRAVIQLMIMVVQAKLYDHFMTSATGGLNKISSGIVNFLFGASPTQVAPSASSAAGSKIVINNNISGFGTIDSNFASNSLIPAINKAISTGQARIG